METHWLSVSSYSTIISYFQTQYIVTVIQLSHGHWGGLSRFVRRCTLLYSAHADLQGNSLAVSNLDDGLDIIAYPTCSSWKTAHMEIPTTEFSKLHLLPTINLCLEGGCIRVYDVQSGQLLQTLEHNKGELSLRFAFRSLYIVFFPLRQTSKLCKLYLWVQLPLQ